MLYADVTDDLWIERGNKRAGSECRGYLSGCARSSTASARGCAARSGSRSSGTKATYAATWSALNYTGVNSAKGTSALSSKDVGISDGQVVTRDCKIEIIF